MGMTKTSEALERLSKNNLEAFEILKHAWTQAFSGNYDNATISSVLKEDVIKSMKTDDTSEDIDFVINSIKKAVAIQ